MPWRLHCFQPCYERDVHTTSAIDLVVLDLGEDKLLGEAHGVVASTVEAVGVATTEVTYARKRSGHQAVEELPHAVTAKGNLATNCLALTQMEACDGLLSAGNHRLLTGDGTQVGDCAVKKLVASGIDLHPC